MLETSKLTKEELDLIQEALTYYEQRYAGDKEKWDRMRGLTATFEAAAKQAEHDSESAQEFIGMMESLKIELNRHIEQEKTTGKVERERITLLKAKMILAQQGKAVDKFLSSED